jgi:hypothetical protein
VERTYELAWDCFCYSAEIYEQPVELDSKDKNYIVDILNNATWVNDLAKCPPDFVFVTQKQRVNYNCECGAFNDVTTGRSTTVSEDRRTAINAILKNSTPNLEK